jgi:hypothetical protein
MLAWPRHAPMGRLARWPGAISSCDGYSGARQLPYTSWLTVGMLSSSARNRRRPTAASVSAAGDEASWSASICSP